MTSCLVASERVGTDCFLWLAACYSLGVLYGVNGFVVISKDYPLLFRCDQSASKDCTLLTLTDRIPKCLGNTVLTLPSIDTIQRGNADPAIIGRGESELLGIPAVGVPVGLKEQTPVSRCLPICFDLILAAASWAHMAAMRQVSDSHCRANACIPGTLPCSTASSLCDWERGR